MGTKSTQLMTTATAQASPNIALIKYWGNHNNNLRLPSTGSISMNLDGLFTRTTVTFSASFKVDSLRIGERPVTGPGMERVSLFLDLVRQMAGINKRAKVVSENNFPSGTGIASSASAFAALALAASKAAGLNLDQTQLSRAARRGSGSASRSVPGGFVEWYMGDDDSDSYAESIAPPEHWDLVDCVAVVSTEHKKTGSAEGHPLAPTSPLQAARVADAPRRLDLCRRAILERDFEALVAIVELDSDMMHAVMMTSTPGLFYWQPASVTVMGAVREWRKSGIPVCYTLDAGPNVHVICPREYIGETEKNLHELPGVQDVLVAGVGGPARIVS
ncbi:MAG: diphosphomevalonate decarboxylase [Anaerolineales bacterium]|nr:diphosphomevalonate decarboxylase [Anaerolineales bacterium]